MDQLIATQNRTRRETEHIPPKLTMQLPEPRLHSTPFCAGLTSWALAG